MNSAGVLLAALLLPAAASPAQGPWIATCDVGEAAPRIFRIGPKLFQQWKPEDGKFGSNLCLSFTCHGDGHLLSGQISSSSVILTITLDLDRKAGSWKTVGASGLSRKEGPCSVKPDAPGAPGHAASAESLPLRGGPSRPDPLRQGVI